VKEMSDTTSDTPLLKSNYIEITAPGTYVDLLVVECDPNTVLYIRDIEFELDYGLATPKPMINISINGKPYIKNQRVLGTSGKIGFGGHLKLWNNNKPLVVQIKTTDTGTMSATAYVTGIEARKF
jgi:hypothetical protein